MIELIVPMIMMVICMVMGFSLIAYSLTAKKEEKWWRTFNFLFGIGVLGVGVTILHLLVTVELSV